MFNLPSEVSPERGNLVDEPFEMHQVLIAHLEFFLKFGYTPLELLILTDRNRRVMFHEYSLF
jgi:hypothetical protein